MGLAVRIPIPSGTVRRAVLSAGGAAAVGAGVAAGAASRARRRQRDEPGPEPSEGVIFPNPPTQTPETAGVEDAYGIDPASYALLPYEVPAPLSDQVHFSLTCAKQLYAGSWAIVDVWVHKDSQRRQIVRRAGEALGGRDFLVRTHGPAAVSRGSVLRIVANVAGLRVKTPRAAVRWDGDVGSSSFAVYAPKEAARGDYAGTVTVHLDGLAICRLSFVLRVVTPDEPWGPKELSASEVRFRSAFASYASEDREAVMLVIQSIRMLRPDLDIFADVLSLRAGASWAEELLREIRSRDVFYLFWSVAASKSTWVEREWRTALDAARQIDPFPLEEAPIPPEFADRHMNDRFAWKRDLPELTQRLAKAGW